MAGPALELWERRLLRLVSEQGAMPFDQLARFLDVEERQALRGWHLAERDLVICRRVLHGEPPWLVRHEQGNSGPRPQAIVEAAG